MLARLFCLITTFSLLLAVPAEAQQKSLSKAELAQKKELIASGTKSWKALAFKEALSDFQEALRISEDSNLYYSMGRCYEMLKRYEEAANSFQRYIDKAPDLLFDDKKEDAQQRIVKLKEILAQGSIEITTEPGSAAIYLDGNKHGEAPKTITAVAPGEHEIEISIDGFKKYSQKFTLSVGQNLILQVPLELLPGSLDVFANEEGTKVLIDGVERGETPLHLDEVPAGKHQLTIVKKGFQKYDQPFTVTPGKGIEVRASLEVATGTIEITSNVIDAEVRLDGKKVGTIPATGVFSLSGIVVGAHEVIVRQKSFLDFTQSFVLSEDSPQKIKAELAGSLAPKIAYGAAAFFGSGTLSMGALCIGSGVLARKSRKEDEDGNPIIFQSEEQNNTTQGLRQQAVTSGTVAYSLLGAALVSGGTGYLLSKRAKSKQVQVSASLTPTGSLLSVGY